MRCILSVALVLAGPAPAQAPLAERVAVVLAEHGPGTRVGLVVADADGREIVAIAPDERFVPASNTKLFTTAAAFATLSDLSAVDTNGGAAIRLEPRGGGAPDVVLEGRGDARLSSAPGCVQDCLATLADAVAARTRVVHDITGDDTLFPDERWSPGMSWNNMPTRSGTGISALTLDDAEVAVNVAPAATIGRPAMVTAPFYRIDNRVMTGARTALIFDRMPGSDLLRVDGTITAGAPPEVLRVGIDDPALHAAWTLRRMLIAKGVRVTGSIGVRHRPRTPSDDPAARGAVPPPRPPRARPLAQLTPPPLIDDIGIINKVSQNVHAELLLRRIGLFAGTGSIADGQAAVQAMLTAAGVERWRYDFADGSGMSSYNRVSPRGVVRFLRWTQGQTWGDAFRSTLPVGGVDGTLRRRFAGTPLAGKLFAKTGTLNAASALAGFMVTASGRTLTFASYAADMPADGSASAAVDKALQLIAAEN